MKNMDNTQYLKILIQEKQVRQTEQGKLLKDQFQSTLHTFSPVNMLMDGLREVVHSPEIKPYLINSAMAIGAGRIAGKLITRNSSSPIRSLLGSIIESIVTKFISYNANGIRATGAILVKKIVPKKAQPTEF